MNANPDIMDPYCVVEGLTGKIDEARYKVGCESGKMFIDVFENDQSYRIRKDQLYCVPRFRGIYELAVEATVQRYLEKKKEEHLFEQKMQEVLKRRGLL